MVKLIQVKQLFQQENKMSTNEWQLRPKIIQYLLQKVIAGHTSDVRSKSFGHSS